MEISVVTQGWDAAQPVNISALLADVASHLNRLLRCPVLDRIVVVAAPKTIPCL